jgi:hypothetical protein
MLRYQEALENKQAIQKVPFNRPESWRSISDG